MDRGLGHLPKNTKKTSIVYELFMNLVFIIYYYVLRIAVAVL